MSTAPSIHTITALKRWSCGEDGDVALPAVDKIKAIHIYDFDNTLFRSPLPNPKLWNGPTIGLLQQMDAISAGGWWHDSRILAATGLGAEEEEIRAWKGWWNEQIVQLVQLSMEQKDALTVVLTGRSEGGFAALMNKMLRSKGLKCDLVLLKPKGGPSGERFSSTLAFKEVVIEQIMETYPHAEELRIYEDRPKHVKRFKDFFMDYNKKQNGIGGYKPTRKPITAEVIQVHEASIQLDPVCEVAEVQKMLNEHNASGIGRRLVMKKTVFYTGYLINLADTEKLLSLVELPKNMPESEMKYLGNNIMITPRPAPNSILEKVGGKGNKLLWEVTGLGVLENKLWAVNVRPVPSTATYYSENPVPVVVLALRKGVRPIDAARIQHWQPVSQEKAHIFETTVGEKILLRIETEDGNQDEYESLFPSGNNKRKHRQEEDHAPRQSSGSFNHHRGGGNHNSNGRGGRGGRGGFRGNDNHRARGRAERGGRGRGRGGSAHYRSLDDAPQQNASSNQGFNGMAYDDFPPLGQQQRSQQNHQYQQENQNPYGGYAPQQYGYQQQ